MKAVLGPSKLRKKRAYSSTAFPSIRASFSLRPLGVLRRQNAIPLVNVDPDVVHENSSFLFSQSLRSRELLSCYLTLLLLYTADKLNRQSVTED